MKKTTNGTSQSRSAFQCQKRWAWESTIARVDSPCDSRMTATTVSPSAASYEIICAEARTAPSNGYFEPDDQPASITP